MGKEQMTRKVDVKVFEIQDPKGLRSNQWYLDDTVDFAKHCMKLEGYVSPMIIGIREDGTRFAFSLPSISSDKGESLMGAKQLLAKTGVEKYITVMEGWYLEGKGNPSEMDIMPSQSERRKEAVIVSVCDDTGVILFKAMEIERGDDGKFAGLAEIKAMQATANEGKPCFGGTFTELLQD